MSKDSDSSNPQKEASKKAIGEKSDEESTRLFSQNEIESIVKEFIRAFIRGQVKIDLALPENLEYAATHLAALPSKDMIKWYDTIGKRGFIKETINICVGIKSSTAKEYKQAINTLFQVIVNDRMTRSLDGSFFLSDVDSRLNIIEEQINDLKRKQEASDMLIRRILEYVERINPAGDR